MHIFYYGIWGAGIIGVVSLLIVSFTYRSTVKDVARLPYPKGKWVKGFYQEYSQFRNKHTDVKNPAVFVNKRMNGRRIGPISMHRMKGVVWYAFVLCFAFLAAELVWEVSEGTFSFSKPFATPLLYTGVGVPLVLLALRQLLAVSFQETRIVEGLLDYVENISARPKDVSVRNTAAVTTEEKEEAEEAGDEKMDKQPDKADVKRTAQGKQKAVSAVRKGRQKKDEQMFKQSAALKALKQEQVVDQIAKSIQETAATNGKYSHLLSKEEEDIVRDVIKEFL